MRRLAILSSASGGGAGIAARRLWSALSGHPGLQPDFIDIATLGHALPGTVVLPGSASRRQETDTHYTAELPGHVRGWMVGLLREYDFVNVHWASFLVSTAELIDVAKAGRPMLITMHDYYYTTGGCHYPAGCTGQADSCVGCPQVNQKTFHRNNVVAAFRDKQHLLGLPNVHICAPSRFLVDEAIRAGMVPPSRAHVIRNIFEPVLPLGPLGAPERRKNVLLIAASLGERRKGTMLALAALTEAAKQVPGLVVHMVGQSEPQVQEMFRAGGLQVVDHGKIDDEHRLAEIYRKVGVLLTCSLEDNWPNVLVEGGAYGVVPVVGSGHGCEEFCEVYGVGSVSRDYTAAGFAEAIRRCIAEYPTVERLTAYAAAVRHSSSTPVVADEYLRVVAAIDAGPAEGEGTTKREPWQVISKNYLSSIGRMRGLDGLEGVASGPYSAVSNTFTGYGYARYVIPEGK